MNLEKMLECNELATYHFELKKKFDRDKDKENSKFHKEEMEKYDSLAFEQMKQLNISELYNNQVSKDTTRALRATRYFHYKLWKSTSIEEKERWSIDLIKMALQRSSRPVVSCSFGIDSIVTLCLTRKTLIELGRNPSDIEIVWCDTLNEFPEVRMFAKRIEKEWDLNLTIQKPKKVLKKIIADHGGVDSSYFFTRKGDRRNGQPLSEKCCGTLKHEPMKRAIKENNWDLQINGVRADESTQRLRACLRDGEYFYSSTEWKAFSCRPIAWWLDEDVWNYVEKESIPYAEMYDNNLIQEYPKNTEELVVLHNERLKEIGLDVHKLSEKQISTVNRRQSNYLEKIGFKLFSPRVG